jgi:branched-chain amino acid transport system ATP-binding protein
MLKLEKVNTFVAKVQVLRNVSLEVDEGEIVCLVGPNGAGKTTTLRSIMGILPVSSGKITFKGQDISRMNPYQRAKLGIGYAPEDRRLYPDFTVEENFLFPARLMDMDENQVKERIFRIFPELKYQTHRLARTLSGGQQKMVAIARAIATDPSLILLDEALEGLAPIVRSRLAKGIYQMKEEGKSILMAESSITHVKGIADRIYRIKRGTIVET